MSIGTVTKSKARAEHSNSLKVGEYMNSKEQEHGKEGGLEAGAEAEACRGGT